MNDQFHLMRFLKAQDGTYESAVEELRCGGKSGHWIWYIFPQIAGLGHSFMSRRYAITSLEEARAYARHPVLGARLLECIDLVMAIDEKSAEQVFGRIDAMKLRSCLTLFAVVSDGNPKFQDALDKYFHGQRDPLTLEALCVKPG